MSDAMVVIGFILSMVGGYVTQPYWHYLVPRFRSTPEGLNVSGGKRIGPSVEPSPRRCRSCGEAMIMTYVPPFFTVDECVTCGRDDDVPPPPLQRTLGSASGVESWDN